METELQKAAKGWFHFCGTLGRPVKVGRFHQVMILCPVCHAECFQQSGMILVKRLQKLESRARMEWEKAGVEAPRKRRSQYSLFVERMRKYD